MKKLLYSVVLFLICAILASCKNGVDKSIERTLDFADYNREALDSVLKHYEKGSLKHKAACFLIANMPYYFAYSSPLIDSMRCLEKAFAVRKYFTKEELDKWKSFDYTACEKVYDVHTISADLLIENIDWAFKVWEERSWSKNYSFEDFCEYILPYRVGNEPLENWRKIYYERYGPILDSLYQGTDVVEAAQSMILYLRKEGFAHNRIFRYPNLGAIFLLENRAGYCRDACDIASYVMRALGIPVAMDNYVISPCYRLRHFWSALIDTTGKAIPFNYPDKKKVSRTEYDSRRRGKVYRTCFGIQPEKIDGIYQDENVPILFRNPFIKDVTKEYFPEDEVSFRVLGNKEKYAYLSIYNEQKYTAIDISTIEKGYARFRNVEDSLVYYPAVKCGDELVPAGYPFLLENGKQDYFIPDMGNLTEVTLQRKYPLLQTFLKTVVGVKIEGANRKDFKDAQLLHEVKNMPEINYNNVMLSNAGSWRYIRYQAPERWFIETAEIMLYEGEERLRPIDMFVENSSDSIYERKLWDMFDDDWVSYYISRERGARAIFDLGSRKSINRIVYIPRNDDNYIHPGDIYELYYHAGTENWKFIERRQADTTFITFSNVPVGAMLWLRDITRGQEERAFYYKDGRQVFP